MQKTELIAKVAKETGATQVETAKVINATIDAIIAALKSGDKVTLTGFGTFEVRKTAAGTGTRPSTITSQEILSTLSGLLDAGNQYAVSGKGRFDAAFRHVLDLEKRLAKPARQIGAAQKIQIPAGKRAAFSAGAMLKAAVSAKKK